eukprot:Selendium_serpulae@DN5661_c0_g2_i3.p2
MVKFPLCLKTTPSLALSSLPFFFLSRTGSFSSLIKRLVAVGTSSTLASLFWMINLTLTLMPFHAEVCLAMSSPTTLAFRPRGPIFGLRTLDAPISPPGCRR